MPSSRGGRWASLPDFAPRWAWLTCLISMVQVQRWQPTAQTGNFSDRRVCLLCHCASPLTGTVFPGYRAVRHYHVALGYHLSLSLMKRVVETNIPASSWADNLFRDRLGTFQIFFNIFCAGKVCSLSGQHPVMAEQARARQEITGRWQHLRPGGRKGFKAKQSPRKGLEGPKKAKLGLCV